MTDQPTPRTEAGRDALAPPCDCGFIPSYDGGHVLDCASRRGTPLQTVLAIEAEVAEQALCVVRGCNRRAWKEWATCECHTKVAR